MTNTTQETIVGNSEISSPVDANQPDVDMSEQQKALVEGKSQDKPKAKRNARKSNGGKGDAAVQKALIAAMQVEYESKKITRAKLASFVKSKKMTPEEYYEITGEEYGKSPMGHNQPPPDIQDLLNKYQPTVKTVKEADEAFLADLTTTRATLNSVDTSLFASMSISLADWLSFHVEGLEHFVSNGTVIKLTMPEKSNKTPWEYFEAQCKDAIVKMVPEAERTHASFVSQVPDFIRGAGLLMGGVASIGYFVLPKETRRMVVPTDEGTLTMPVEIDEDKFCVRSVVIPANKYRPVIIDAERKERPNKKTTPIMLTKKIAEYLVAAMCDSEGEIQYDKTSNDIKSLGVVTGFLTASMLRLRKANEEKAKKNDKKPAKTPTKLGTPGVLGESPTPPATNNAEPGLVKGRETSGETNQDAPDVTAREKVLIDLNKDLLLAVKEDRKDAMFAVVAEMTKDPTKILTPRQYMYAEVTAHNLHRRLLGQYRGQTPPKQVQEYVIAQCLFLHNFVEQEGADFFPLDENGNRVKAPNGGFLKYSAS